MEGMEMEAPFPSSPSLSNENYSLSFKRAMEAISALENSQEEKDVLSINFIKFRDARRRLASEIYEKSIESNQVSKRVNLTSTELEFHNFMQSELEGNLEKIKSIPHLYESLDLPDLIRLEEEDDYQFLIRKLHSELETRKLLTGQVEELQSKKEEIKQRIQTLQERLNWKREKLREIILLIETVLKTENNANNAKKSKEN